VYLILSLIDFLGWIFDADPSRTQQHEEAYLADSVDLYELEYRMRQLDRRHNVGQFGLNA
jgi:hypothetical protein